MDGWARVLTAAKQNHYKILQSETPSIALLFVEITILSVA